MADLKSLLRRLLRPRIKLPKMTHKSQMKLGFIKLGILFNIDNSVTSYFLSFLLGVFAAVLLLLFTKGPGLYSSGFTGLTQGVARIVYAVTGNETLFTILFWGLFTAINIPIIIFSYFKISKKFTIKTAIYSFSSAGVGLLLDFTIPLDSYVRHIFTDALMIAQASDVDGRLTQAREAGIALIAWYGSGPNASATGSAILITFAYVICSGFASGFLFACVYITGGSTGGTDIVAFYLADSRRKQVAGIITTINTFSLIVGYVLGSYVAFGLAGNDWSAMWLLSPILFASFVNIRLALTVYNQLFPKDRLIEMSIITERADVIVSALSVSNYTHGTTISEAYGAYSGRSKKVISTVMSYYELLTVANVVRIADPNCFVQLRTVWSVIGKFARRTVREQER